MSHFLKKVSGALVGVGVIFASGVAHATLLADTSAAITTAAGDAVTIGGYVVGGICTMIVIGLAIKMVRKL